MFNTNMGLHAVRLEADSITEVEKLLSSSLFSIRILNFAFPFPPTHIAHKSLSISPQLSMLIFIYV